jgi:hypothetical protein
LKHTHNIQPESNERTRQTLDRWLVAINRRQARRIATRKVYDIFTHVNGLRSLHHLPFEQVKPANRMRPVIIKRTINADAVTIFDTWIQMRKKNEWLREHMRVKGKELTVIIPGTLLAVAISIIPAKNDCSLVQISIPSKLPQKKVDELKQGFRSCLDALKKLF